MKRAALIAVAAIAVGCAPALREPPSVASLGSRPMVLTTPDAASLLRNADAAWSRRPDISEVREAEALYLQAAQLDQEDVVGLIGAVRAKAWLAERTGEAKARQDLAVSGVQTAQWCGRRKPTDAACDYWLAIAVGLQAREVRLTADDGLKTMVAALKRAIEEDPTYDDAGPYRVFAIVLVRAPSWPLGPGDIELAVEYAQKAVELRPEFPPNMLALGEALVAARQREAARLAYDRAESLAVTRRDAGDPDADDWIAQAEQALAKIKA